MKKNEAYTLEIGNMKKKLIPLKVKPKSKKQAEKERAKRKRDHRKMNHTRVAASLTARKMRPCKK